MSRGRVHDSEGRGIEVETGRFAARAKLTALRAALVGTGKGEGDMTEREQLRVSTHPLCAGSGEERVRQYWRAASGLRWRAEYAALYPDWSRVRCLDPDADTEMLAALEIDHRNRLRAQPADHPKPIMALLEEFAFQRSTDHGGQGLSGGDLSDWARRPDAAVCR